MKVKLTEGTFTLMREGEQVLQVVSVEGKPKNRPKNLEMKFKNAYGETVSNTYQLDGSNEKAMFVTSFMLKALLGDIKEFDTEDIPTLVGKCVRVEITHTEVESKKEDGKMLTFANIGKIIGSASESEMPVSEESVKPTDAAEPSDDVVTGTPKRPKL
nr:MAG TPA: hypothetical protein [Caudoviricetes sp.]